MKKIDVAELTGRFGWDRIVVARSMHERILEDQLREEGRVPVIDMQTKWTINWDEESDTFDFALEMSHVYVGKRKAQEEILGWSSEKGEAISF